MLKIKMFFSTITIHTIKPYLPHLPFVDESNDNKIIKYTFYFIKIHIILSSIIYNQMDYPVTV